MALSIRHFKAFVALAEDRSFTGAARRLHISQPGLSLMVRDAEAQLDARLVERTTRSVELTAAGRHFLQAALRIVAEYDTLVPAVGRLSTERRTALHVAATPMFTASVMPRVILELRESNPALALRLTEATPQGVEALVGAGEVDCGLGIFPKRIAGLVHRPLFSFAFVYLESRARPVLFGNKVPRRLRWVDLPDVPFVQLPPASELQKAIERCLRSVSIASRPRALDLTSFESLIAMAAAGVGPAILPSFAVTPEAGTKVVAVRLGTPTLEMDFHMISKRGREAPAAIGAFTGTLLRKWRPASDAGRHG